MGAICDLRILQRSQNLIPAMSHADVAVWNTSPCAVPGDSIFYQPHINQRGLVSIWNNIFFRCDTHGAVTSYRFIKTIELSGSTITERTYAIDAEEKALLFKVTYRSSVRHNSFVLANALYHLQHASFFKNIPSIAGLINPILQILECQAASDSGLISSGGNSVIASCFSPYGRICPDIWSVDTCMNLLSRLTNGLTQSSDFYQSTLSEYRSIAAAVAADTVTTYQSLNTVSTQSLLVGKRAPLFDTSPCFPLGWSLPTSQVFTNPPKLGGIAKRIFTLGVTDFQVKVSIDPKTAIPRFPYKETIFANRYGSLLRWDMGEDRESLRKIIMDFCATFVAPILCHVISPPTQIVVTVTKTFNDECLISVETTDPRRNFCIHLDAIGYSIASYGASLVITPSTEIITLDASPLTTTSDPL